MRDELNISLTDRCVKADYIVLSKGLPLCLSLSFSLFHHFSLVVCARAGARDVC